MKPLNLLPDISYTLVENRHQLTKETISVSTANGVLVASPANPAGTVLKKDELGLLISVAKKKNFISDEIYHGFNYNGLDVTALELDDQAIVINSFLKFYSLTGWRVGWMIVPLNCVRVVEKLAQNLFICSSQANQYLALYSLNSSTNFDEKVKKYQKNRDLPIDFLPNLGFTNIVWPDGSFYLYADIAEFEIGSDILARKILKESGIAITSGLDFDIKRGINSVRFTF